ncbi:hypothetical protein CRENBAI_000760 [Crenichthys baileyi]|uniref:Uncharacterized protein n=1 Tax=Crenichthys baileyi TaxID=28760 RepID=A0AAV9RTI0_9TELE
MASYVALYVLFAVLAVLLLIILVKVCKTKRHQSKEAEVNIIRSKLEAVDTQEVMDGADLYENHDNLVMCSEQRTCKEQSADSLSDGNEEYYENHATEKIYCHEPFYTN